jgi:hypothetical protein
MRNLVLTSGLLAGAAFVLPAPVAAQMRVDPALTAGAGLAASEVQYRRYGGNRRYYSGNRRRSNGGAAAAGIIGGLAAGAIIGGALSNQYGYGQPQTVYGVHDPAAVEYCIRRFRSYDVRSGTYLGYDGFRHACP